MALNNFRFAVGSLNTRSLDASGPGSYDSSRPRLFVLDHMIRDHRLDLLHLQETGRFHNEILMKRFFFPDFHNAITSVGEISQHSIACFYNPATLVHVSSSVLEVGRATLSIFRSKKNPEKVLASFNVYGFSGGARVDQQNQTNLLNIIGDSINLCKRDFLDLQVVLAGDFNADFLKPGAPKTRQLRAFALTHDLIEVSLPVESTWRARRGENFSVSKIDHIFMTKFEDHRSFSFPCPSSDHLAVIASNRVKCKIKDPLPN